jgi:hypothetical protein
MRPTGWRGWPTGRIGRGRVRIRCRRRWRWRWWSCGWRIRRGGRGGWCSSWPSGTWRRRCRSRRRIGRWRGCRALSRRLSDRRGNRRTARPRPGSDPGQARTERREDCQVSVIGHVRPCGPSRCDRSQSRSGYILPDLVEFMLATGCRIGEACAARYGTNSEGKPLLDLDAGTWEVNATIVREEGVGLFIQERPKSTAGRRVLALPPSVVKMLRRRAGELRLRASNGVVFGSPSAKALRDPSNTPGDLREVLDAIDCPICLGTAEYRRIAAASSGVRTLVPSLGCIATRSARRSPPGWTTRAARHARSPTNSATQSRQ